MRRIANHFAALLLALSAGAAWATGPIPAAGVAQPIDASGFRAALAKERGRVVVLNVWATWCVPCLREVPELLAVAGELRRNGVTLIGVAVDDPAPGAEVVEHFRARYFPAFFTYARRGPEIDELAGVVDPAWNEVVPTTYILDRDGRVAARIQGRKTPAEFRAAILAVANR